MVVVIYCVNSLSGEPNDYALVIDGLTAATGWHRMLGSGAAVQWRAKGCFLDGA